jgi:protein Tex
VHRSELGPRFVRDPLAVVSVGDTVTVRVLSVDRERGRIALSMRDV